MILEILVGHSFGNVLVSVLLAIIIDSLFGWPDFLFKILSHPVVWIGRLIKTLDTRLNIPAKSPFVLRFMGILTLLITTTVTLAITLFIWLILPTGPFGILINALLIWPLLAIHSLHQHVDNIRAPLAKNKLEKARMAIAMIVSRDPKTLDQSAICRAAIESLAENTSDGVIAPLFWACLFGLPGVGFYKAVNTLDSMIGYKNEKYLHFGWASARFDDLVNLIPARLTALLFLLASGAPLKGLKCIKNDAGKHRSPNAGWPESAMAGALDIRLSGPRLYDGVMTEDLWVNDGKPDPDHLSLGRALALYRRTIIGITIILFLAAASLNYESLF
ncbi:adenosylcobinamide-phosphate synthase CbiB [Sneathiella aquimaris]|uniref:adenosylcobinamide-phosphate synthase CbiB n=1 Tax=Sneathiella aquimaris TaxID=2599305 RepID=UPI00146C9F59|nr:adenosylcobinamide-phosphate synthase CbiB [Sneathiella aquimaris]